jgi:hypothetical protein
MVRNPGPNKTLPPNVATFSFSNTMSIVKGSKNQHSNQQRLVHKCFWNHHFNAVNVHYSVKQLFGCKIFLFSIMCKFILHPLQNISKSWLTKMNVFGLNFEPNTSCFFDSFLFIFWDGECTM